MPLVAEWFNDPDFSGRYDPLDPQQSLTEIEKKYENLGVEEKWFIMETKDRAKVGFVGHFTVRSNVEIGYALIPSERRKGYGAEAIVIMVDYLFLSKNIVRIQAGTNVENEASQKVLEKAGFQKEGTSRKQVFVRGKWTDFYNYSILREEWKEPRILTRAA